jgi:SAM-dependent methyltransferase
MDHGVISAFFKAMGDPNRLRFLHLLSREELTVSELVEILELPQSTVSRQLKPLREQGLISDRPVGAATYYRASLEADHENSDSALRDALIRILNESDLPPRDGVKLDRLVALRFRDGGEEFFDCIGQRWDALREDCFGLTFHLEAFMKLIPGDLTVADLGTGTGYLLPVLGRCFKKVIGLDQSRPMLDLAKKRVQSSGLKNIELKTGSLESIPLRAGSVDLALCILMFHHLADVEAVLAEIRRVLKPGGRLMIIELHKHQNEKFRVAMADRRSGISPKQMNSWLNSTGFSELENWDLPRPEHPEHPLAPIPKIYGLTGSIG